ncbi:MAG: hypothetical protein SOY65_03100 [Marinifilaceae bacterium]|nr:hypothetical protein [Marinifilaceae bacterium]
MKKILTLLTIFAGIYLAGCHDVTVGYLDTEEAGYDPDTMHVRRTLVVDSVKNPLYDVYYQMAESFYKDFGYNTVEECLNEMYGIKEYTYSADYVRWKTDMPWLSTKIQGVIGTEPMYIEIKDVTSSEGEAAADAMRAVINVRGDGMISVPLDVSSIPLGTYEVSLTVYNEGYSKDLDDIFTIYVDEE